MTYNFFGLTTVGNYTFTIQGSIAGSSSADVSFTVYVTAPPPTPIIIPNTGPPTFSPPLADISLDLGKT
jgi:hypothetical protein